MSTVPRTNYHHGQLRPALIAEARTLLDAGGPAAVSLREAARRAGVSATASYRHFADKDALLAAVAAEGFREFGEALAAPIRQGKPFSEMGRAYVEFALTHPGLFRLMFSPLIAKRHEHPDLAAGADRAFEALRVAARLAPRELLAGSLEILLQVVDPTSEGVALVSVIHGLLRRSIPGGVTVGDRLVARDPIRQGLILPGASPCVQLRLRRGPFTLDEERAVPA